MCCFAWILKFKKKNTTKNNLFIEVETVYSSDWAHSSEILNVDSYPVASQSQSAANRGAGTSLGAFAWLFVIGNCQRTQHTSYRQHTHIRKHMYTHTHTASGKHSFHHLQIAAKQFGRHRKCNHVPSVQMQTVVLMAPMQSVCCRVHGVTAGAAGLVKEEKAGLI